MALLLPTRPDGVLGWVPHKPSTCLRVTRYRSGLGRRHRPVLHRGRAFRALVRNGGDLGDTLLFLAAEAKAKGDATTSRLCNRGLAVESLSWDLDDL